MPIVRQAISQPETADLEDMVKRITRGAAVLCLAALALAACGEAPEETDNGDAGTTEEVDYKACLVSDQGGFDDQSFNQAGFEGLTQAEEELGVEAVEVESSAETDFGPNVDSLVQQDCNLVVGAGFLLEDTLQAAAEANTDTDFALVDSAFSAPDFSPVELENGKPLLFDTAQASYLAGYLAAGMSETGVVATFGGIQIPSVSVFMDGFSDGIDKYNEDNGTAVTLLGWDKEAQTGSFTGDFENQANGQNLANGFIDQNADIIMPVAGPVGLGSAAAAQEAGNVSIIWVDSDGFDTTEYGELIMTSVVKEIGAAVYDTIEQAISDEGFTSEPYVGTLENEGVGLAPYHDFEAEIPAELVTKVDELRQQIIDGEITVESPNAP